MSKQDKAIAKFLSGHGNQEWSDAVRFLKAFGYEQLPPGKGSRRKFRHAGTERVLILHEPHPEKTIKKYMYHQIINAIEESGIDLDEYRS